MPVLDTQKLIDNRVEAIRAHHKSAGLERAQLDVSGGLDSAVMLGLLTRALGPESITAVYSNISSSKESQIRAEEVADIFGVNLCVIDLSFTYNTLLSIIKNSLENDAHHKYDDIAHRCSQDPTIEGSLRSTLRAPVGRAFNRLSGGGIRHGTGNECEDRWLRFYQKGGDGEVDTNPIAMLSKGEVFQLGRALGVPRSILTALPTPDLQGVGEEHNDEAELKALTGIDWTYSKVDPDTGEYTKVGSIEAMSRSLDMVGDWYGECTTGDYLFNPDIDEGTFFKLHQISMGVHTMFSEVTNFIKMAKSARKIESSTRHKMNPNCPSLGNRGELLELEILTNELPMI